MNKKPKIMNQSDIDCFIDITADTCPITYVKTKLKLEAMDEGQILEVRLIGSEPLENVPRSAAASGHQVLSVAPEEEGGGVNDVHRILIRRGA